MATSSSLSYAQRSQRHPNALVRRLFDIAEKKETNITVSADLETTEELLKIADALGPYIAVLKTHIDIIDDFSAQTIKGLIALSEKHNFLLFEDRKFTDIGSTVQKQYRGGPLRIRDWAHIVNVTMLPGEGIVEAIEQTIKSAGTPSRGILILAEMTSKGSHAVDKYTADSVRVARKYPDSVIGFVATRELSSFASGPASTDEDLVVFTTGVNISSKGDSLGQQYQTPTTAVEGGSDFLIAGRGIYAASDPVAAVQEYRKAGWDAYLARIGKK